MSRLFVCGDTHGRTMDTKKISLKAWPEQKELTKEDVLVQLGDFGWIWYPFGVNKEQEYWLNWLANRKYALLVVLGNHENYDIIDTLPEKEMFGGIVKYLVSSGRFGIGEIYFAKRGEVYTIGNKKCFCFGGALSTDRGIEALGTSYWKQELPTHEEYEYGFSQIDKHNRKFDYVFSHTCPSRIIENIIHKTPYTEARFNDPVAKYFDEIDNLIEFKEWHFGHFHTDIKVIENENIFQCHYESIPVELKTIS